MAISRYEEMGELEFDILKEIGSIGGGNAATALSSMLNAKVNMSMPAVKVLGFNAEPSWRPGGTGCGNICRDVRGA